MMMSELPRTLGIIPARGGSRGIPGKNIRPLAGKPLLAWTAAQVARVPELTLAVVSTDDTEIAALGRKCGLRIIQRPAKLATADAPTEWALIHALDELMAGGEAPFDLVAVLEPTSPLRRPETISTCIRKLAESRANSLMTVVESRANLGHVIDGYFRPLIPHAPRRRQDRQPFHIESSTVYVCRVDHLRRSGTLVADDWLAVVVSPEEAIDINEPLDFILAESVIANLREYS